MLVGCAGGEPPAPPPAAASAPSTDAAAFDRTLEFQGVRFRVAADNESSVGTVTITPSGLATDDSPMTREIEGRVRGAEVADLDADQSPEIYVYVTSDGSGAYGSLVAVAANRKKSLSDIYLPPVAENPKANVGYMGHDEFAVGEGRLLHRFPIYRDGDTNAQPTGGMRQLQYRLEAGEAGWVLVVDRVVEY
jgi:hypothetical protein